MDVRPVDKRTGVPMPVAKIGTATRVVHWHALAVTS